MSNHFIALEGNTIRVCFSKGRSHAQMLKELEMQLNHLIASNALRYGPLIKVQGPLSMPAAFILAHHVAHLFGAIAVFDPYLQGHVVAITQNPNYQLGDIVE